VHACNKLVAMVAAVLIVVSQLVTTVVAAAAVGGLTQIKCTSSPGWDLGAPIRVKGLISEADAAHIVELARPLLRKSTISTGDVERDGGWRTSRTALLPHTSDRVVAALEQKLSQLVGIPPEFAEPLAVSEYTRGQLYAWHADNDPTGGWTDATGGRHLTILIWLNTVRLGGETVFSGFDTRTTAKDATTLPFKLHCAKFIKDPSLAPPGTLAFKPLAGDALAWRTFTQQWDGSSAGTHQDPPPEYNSNTTHGSCPTAFDKFVIQRWFSVRPQNVHLHTRLLSHMPLGAAKEVDALVELAPFRRAGQLWTQSCEGDYTLAKKNCTAKLATHLPTSSIAVRTGTDFVGTGALHLSTALLGSCPFLRVGHALGDPPALDATDTDLAGITTGVWLNVQQGPSASSSVGHSLLSTLAIDGSKLFEGNGDPGTSVKVPYYL
jgi:hypothetical protein